MKQLIGMAFLLATFAGCSQKNVKTNDILKEINLSWELESNLITEQPRFRARFIMVNNSNTRLDSGNWEMYYNQSPRTVDVISGNATINHISGDFYQLKPGKNFSLAPGDTTEIVYEGSAWLIKNTDAPLGVYFVVKDEEGNDSQTIATDLEILPFNRPEQSARHRSEATPLPTPQVRYQENQDQQLLETNDFPLIVPEPVSISRMNGQAIISSSTTIFYHQDLQQEAEYLQSFMQNELDLSLELKEAESGPEGNIFLNVQPLQINGKTKNAYRVRMDQNIRIIGSDAAGVFYGIQSLLQLIPPEAHQQKPAEIGIPKVAIDDVPGLDYRGMHLDVVRHFHSRATVKKLLDIMAYYKLNKFLFNFTEDEGWRLEIKALPELTEIGSLRGHTLTDENQLHPAYGSGPDPSNNNGAGYYTQQDFIEILQYAHQRHIEVIPEINLPGHARAAIKAMEARYRRLMMDNKEAEAMEYRLIEPEDDSEYFSAQAYTDNVVSVCKESTYKFFSTVLDEVIALYERAGVPLPFIHSGGDEVPEGAWTASPACQALLAESEKYQEAAQLQQYFLSRIKKIAAAKGLKVAGWEEIALKKDPEVAYPVNPEFAGGDVIPYVWNSLWGAQDLGYRLANAGYPVVLCNVTNLYFDLAYNRDPEEPGLYWGGFVDTKDAFRMAPFNVFVSTTHDAMGNEFDPEADFADLVRLDPAAEENILGIQGQLWSETIQNSDMLEYYYLPKLLGLAQSAWKPRPQWAEFDNQAQREAAFHSAWNEFANALGQREMHRLAFIFGGYNNRLPLPGLVVEDGMIKANVRFPGLTIKYTIDGSEPNIDSPLFQDPVSVDAATTIKAKTFDLAGRSSRTSTILVGERGS